MLLSMTKKWRVRCRTLFEGLIDTLNYISYYKAYRLKKNSSFFLHSKSLGKKSQMLKSLLYEDGH